MPLDSSTLFKNHGSCNFMVKYYFTISLQQFFSTKILNQFFSLCRATGNLHARFFWTIEWIKVVLIILGDMIFILLSPALKQVFQKLCYEFPHALSFPCTWTEKGAIIFIIFWDLCFTKFSFHHKWNDARLLLINRVCRSRLTCDRTT